MIAPNQGVPLNCHRTPTAVCCESGKQDDGTQRSQNLPRIVARAVTLAGKDLLSIKEKEEKRKRSRKNSQVCTLVLLRKTHLLV